MLIAAPAVMPDVSNMPMHDFRPMTLRDSLVLAIPDITVLVLMILVLFAASYVSFIRYDVR